MIFVRDYVQLGFNGPRLTCWVWPRLTIDGVVHTMGDSGYRDRLCSFISRVPTDTADEPGVGIVLRFGMDFISVNPTAAELTDAVEVAMIWGFEDKHWEVWRPGEGTFAETRRADG